MPSVRAAEAADVERMRAIEVAAGALFADIGLHTIASDDPPEPAALLAHVADGTAWVATDDEGVVVGYAIASVVDDEGHLDQVSVVPEAGGRGFGRQLIERVCAWATEAGFVAVTLTTFRDVPWNGPIYARMGFQDLADAELGPGLAAIRRAEIARGLDVVPRIAMRRRL